MERSNKSKSRRAGRPEEPLVVEGNWKDAVKSALGRGKPPKTKKTARKKRS